MPVKLREIEVGMVLWVNYSTRAQVIEVRSDGLITLEQVGTELEVMFWGWDPSKLHVDNPENIKVSSSTPSVSNLSTRPKYQRKPRI